MTVETKTEESTLHRFLQEMLQLVVLVEEICTRFYSSKRINMNLISFNGYLVFRERELDSALHRKCQKKLKITWSSHVIFV